MESKLTKPVYEFLGLKLLHCTYSREKNTEIEFLSINILNSAFDNKTNIITILYNIGLKFIDCENSNFIFSAGYKINDLEWKKAIGDELHSLCLSVAFPFIRNIIGNITDDFRGRIVIPMIDLRNADLSKGIKISHKK